MLTQDTLTELRSKNLPKVTAEMVGITAKPDLDPEKVAKVRADLAFLDKYFAGFTMIRRMEGGKPAEPGDGWFRMGISKCPSCNELLDGISGTFVWGFAHGEGNCSKCGWPCRAYHFLKNEEGKELFRPHFPYTLAYHPDVVTCKNEGE